MSRAIGVSDEHVPNIRLEFWWAKRQAIGMHIPGSIGTDERIMVMFGLGGSIGLLWYVYITSTRLQWQKFTQSPWESAVDSHIASISRVILRPVVLRPDEAR